MTTNGLLVLLISWLGAVGIPACALLYFHHARLPRPPIGVFDHTDLWTICLAIMVLPLLYLVMPVPLLTSLFALLFFNVLYQGWRAMFPRLVAVLLALVLIGADILAALEIPPHWQPSPSAHWIANDLVMVLVVVVAANLYVQLGMRMRHITVLALFLACYDGLFAWGIPLTPLLATHFGGTVFDPVFGFSIGNVQGFYGIGDLFVFALVVTVVYKGFGISGVLVSFALVACFGILFPTLGLPLLVTLLGWRPITLVPVQVFFGPAVCLLSVWLARRSQERSMSQWLAERGDLAPAEQSR